MKFTPTNLFKAIAMGSGKYIQLKAFVRITSVLSDPLDSGVAWTDISIYLASNKGQPKLPVMWTKVEWQVGKPAFDSIKLESNDIPFWRDKIFGACSETQQIELKIEMRLGLSETQLASDIVYGFSGYVDKKPTWREKEGTLTFTVIGYDEIGSRMSAEQITDQIINSNVDGAGKDGILLYNIPGVWVTAANISSYILKKGVHTISYEYNAGAPQAALDDGIMQTLPTSDGVLVLVNLDGLQKLEIYIVVADLSSNNSENDVIIAEAGNLLPRTWYKYIWVYRLLQKLYEKIGITNYKFDDFRLKTCDDQYTTSFYEIPPGSVYYDKPGCLIYDSTHGCLWIGVGDKVYKRDMTTHVYTDIGQVASGYTVVRFFIEQADDGLIWGLARTSAGAYRIFRIVTATNVLTSWALVNRTDYSVNEYGPQNFAFANAIGSGGYIYYVSNTDDVYYFKLSDQTEHFAIGIGPAGLPYRAGWSNGTDYFCQIREELTPPAAPDTGMLIRIYYSSGAWHGAQLNGGTYVYQIREGAYGDDVFVYCDGQKTRYYDHNENTIGDLSSYLSSNFENRDNKISFLLAAAPSQIYYSYGFTIIPVGGDGLTYPMANDRVENPNKLTYDPVSGNYYLLYDLSNLLVQYSKKISMYIGVEANWSGMFIIDAIREIEQSFELVGIISPDKKVIVYRRFDEDGNPKTSGQTASITIGETEDIQKEENYICACTAIVVDNGIESHSYDGTDFDPGFLGDGRIATINGRFIPTEILKDIAFYAYKFFNKNLSMYTFPLANVALWQHECFDGLSVTFTETKIKKTATGPLYGVGIDPSGSTIFQVLL